MPHTPPPHPPTPNPLNAHVYVQSVRCVAAPSVAFLARCSISHTHSHRLCFTRARAPRPPPRCQPTEVHNDLAEALYLQKPKSLDTLTSRVCKKWTKACRKEGRPLPDGHAWKDEEFKEMDDKGRETVAMMRKMKASGMPDMSMYTRDDMDELMDMDPEAMAEAMADEL